MKCKDVRILISAAADGELTERERFALDEHLAECLDCRKERNSVGAVRRALTAWEAMEPAESLADAFALRLRREHEMRTRSWWTLIFPRSRSFGLASAAAAAALVLVYFAVQPRTQAPAPRGPAVAERVPEPVAPRPSHMAAIPAPEVWSISTRPLLVPKHRAPRKWVAYKRFHVAGRRLERAPVAIALAPAAGDAAKALANSARMEAVRRVTEKAARLRSLVAEADITIERALLRPDIEVLEAHDVMDLDNGADTPG